MKFEVQSIKPRIGAAILTERAALKDDEIVNRCVGLLEERGVLVFPRIGLSDEEQLAFTERFGTRVAFTGALANTNNEHSDVYRVTFDPSVNSRPEYVQGTFLWHMDGLVSPEIVLPKASLLSARRLSAKGGQTEFASTYAAYEELSDEDKSEIDGLRVVHCIAAGVRHCFEAESDEYRAITRSNFTREHPLVWRHRSGRKSLIIAATADRVIGMPLPDGRALIARLTEWAAQPEFRYRHQWQEGDLVIWDNCGTLHRVIPYSRDSGRMMHRTTIAGVEPVS
jgi:alpha-ketoglutarate-dependent taurine dioxygenase